MARTISEIYNEMRAVRDTQLKLTTFDNQSKMSVLDGIMYMVSVSIYVFENVMDVFKIEIEADLRNRVNGTPNYYSKMLLEYQYGDQLEVAADGLSFGYSVVDPSKQIITRVSYYEEVQQGFFDKWLLMKVAKGEAGAYEQLSADELSGAVGYMGQIAFAGTRINVVSRRGDVLLPRFTVYHTGAVSDNQLLDNIVAAITDFVGGLDFNGLIYEQHLIDVIQKVSSVVDVYIDPNAEVTQGLHVVQYDDSNQVVVVDGVTEQRVVRVLSPTSGYVTQSTGEEDQASIATWKECLVLKIEN